MHRVQLRTWQRIEPGLLVGVYLGINTLSNLIVLDTSAQAALLGVLTCLVSFVVMVVVYSLFAPLDRSSWFFPAFLPWGLLFATTGVLAFALSAGNLRFRLGCVLLGLVYIGVSRIRGVVQVQQSLESPEI